MPKGRNRPPRTKPSENDQAFGGGEGKPRLSQEDRFWRNAKRMLRSGQFQNPFDWMNQDDGIEAAQESQEDYMESMQDFYRQNPYGTPGGGQYIGDETATGQTQASPYAQPEMTQQLTPDALFPQGASQGTQPFATGSGGADLVLANAEAAAQAPAAAPQGAPQAVPTSGKLSIPQAYQTFRQAGFGDEQARLMTAIAMGESGLNPRAHNPNAGTGDNSYGLTQVNMLGNLGPARMQQFGLKSNEDLFDPLTNAKAAFGISGGGKNFGPWSVYKKGIHNQFLDDVQAALASSPYADPALAGQLSEPAPTSSPPPATTQPSSTAEPEEEDEDEEDD